MTPQEYVLEVASLAGMLNNVLKEFNDGINGSKPWSESFRNRLEALKGVSEDVFTEALANIGMREGAAVFTSLMKKKGWVIFVITGGFTLLETALRRGGIIYDGFIAHELIFRAGKLHSYVVKYGDKGEVTRELKEEFRPEVTVAVGDGWNDVPMFREADLAVGFKPKGPVKQQVDVEVSDFNGLIRMLRLIT